MKNSKIKSVLFLAILTIAFVGCKNAVEQKKDNLKDANEKVAVANDELNEARLDSAKQYEKFKVEINKRLLENDLLIANLKDKIKSEKKELREKSEKELDTIKAKNEALKLAIQKHKEDAYDSWNVFKQNFNKDLDDLGKSISKMAHKNMKKT